MHATTDPSAAPSVSGDGQSFDASIWVADPDIALLEFIRLSYTFGSLSLTCSHGVPTIYLHSAFAPTCPSLLRLNRHKSLEIIPATMAGLRHNNYGSTAESEAMQDDLLGEAEY